MSYSGSMRKRFLGLILLLGLALRPCLIFLQDTNLVIDLLFFDDSFYLLNIARNIAAGNGITHDGLHMTNGFQPLYVATMIPVFWFAGADRIFPIYFAAVLLSACSLFSAYFCFKIVERVCSAKVAFCSLPFTLFSPLVLNYSLNGAETSLAIMLFLAAARIAFRLYPGLERRIFALELGGPSMFSIYRIDQPVDRGSDEK